MSTTVGLTIEDIQRALTRRYNPPIRGLTSKRARIRKKAERRLKGTFRWMAYEPNPFLRFFPKTADQVGGWLTIPVNGFYGSGRTEADRRVGSSHATAPRLGDGYRPESESPNNIGDKVQ